MSEETNQLVSLESFNIKHLSEVQNKREEQLKVVENNPFVTIEDNDTFTTAKKNRTALVSARTALEKERTLVISKVKEKITVPLGELYDEFIDITKPHEEKQQAEVKRWEGIKEAERQAKLKLEAERKESHRNNINTIVQTITEQIKNLDYNSSLSYEVKPMLNDKEVILEDFEEFAPTLLAELESLKFTLSSRKETLTQQENIRVEKENLENERKELERVNGHKQTIQNFYNNWINKIYSATYETILQIKKDFNSEKGISVQEFQHEYGAKRAELVKEFERREATLNSQEQQRVLLEKQQAEAEIQAQKIADENAKKQAAIDAENERLRIEREEIQKEKEELLKHKRIDQLKNLGFDDDLVLNTEHCKIIFPLEDILCPEEEFQDLLNNTKYRIENPPKVEFTEDIQEVEDGKESIYEIESIDETHIGYPNEIWTIS